MTLSEAREATNATLNRHDPDTYTVGDTEFLSERVAADAEIAFLRRQNEDAARSREELVRQMAERDRRIGEMGKVVALAQAYKKRRRSCEYASEGGDLRAALQLSADCREDLKDLDAALTALAPKETK